MLFKLLVIVFSVTVSFAQTTEPLTGTFDRVEQEFMIDPNMDFSGRIYYRCDTVELNIKNLLEKMGARDVEVHCIGGIDQFRPIELSTASVSMQYTVLSAKKSASGQYPAQWTPIKIRLHDSCHLLTQVFKHVKSQFELKNVSGPSSCFSTNQNFRVQFDVLTEKPEAYTREPI